ncbi:MAG: T9SS type A sorting domain-containing protein [Bacteroidota bacterium]|nr:T9SS type A sorting domain-containing protein [Bacteroidota bacterium]
MKPIMKYFFIAICISFSSNLVSQNLISENKIWRIGAKIYSEPCCGHRNDAYKFQGDSIINDTTYAKLYTTTDESLTNWKIYGLWRETDGLKIFKRDLYYHKEQLMYDFSLVKNDIFITQGITFKVDSVLIFNWGGKLRKHWYLNPVSGDEFHRTVWIEGVGQRNYFLSNINGSIGALPFLLCYTENGQLVYQNPEYNTCFYTSSINIQNPTKGFKVYPNPVSGELFVQLTTNIDENYTLELYSLKGELVKKECLDAGNNLHRVDTSSLRNGIYILRLISDSGKYSEEVIIKE